MRLERRNEARTAQAPGPSRGQHGREPLAAHGHHPRSHARARRVGRRIRQRSVADVRRSDGRRVCGHHARERNRDCAAARACVGPGAVRQRGRLRHRRLRQVQQRLCLGARDEHAGAYREHQVPPVRRGDQVLEWLARQAAAPQVAQGGQRAAQAQRCRRDGAARCCGPRARAPGRGGGVARESHRVVQQPGQLLAQLGAARANAVSLQSRRAVKERARSQRGRRRSSAAQRRTPAPRSAPARRRGSARAPRR